MKRIYLKFLYKIILISTLAIIGCHENSPDKKFDFNRTKAFKLSDSKSSPITDITWFECRHFDSTNQAYFKDYSNLTSKSSLLYKLEGAESRIKAKFLWSTILHGTGTSTYKYGSRTNSYVFLIGYHDNSVATIFIHELSNEKGDPVEAEAKINNSLIPIKIKSLDILINNN